MPMSVPPACRRRAPPLPQLAASTALPECLPGRCSPTAQLSTTAVPSKTELAARHKSCGALAIALASENMFASGRAFWLTGALANGGLIPDAELFSYIMYIMMTEGVTFALSCATTFVMVLEWTGPRGHFALAGLLLGLLCLTRFSFLVPTTVLAGLIVFNSWIGQRSLRSVRNDAIVF
jgi:hypothetical protein